MLRFVNKERKFWESAKAMWERYYLFCQRFWSELRSVFHLKYSSQVQSYSRILLPRTFSSLSFSHLTGSFWRLIEYLFFSWQFSNLCRKLSLWRTSSPKLVLCASLTELDWTGGLKKNIFGRNQAMNYNNRWILKIIGFISSKILNYLTDSK